MKTAQALAAQVIARVLAGRTLDQSLGLAWSRTTDLDAHTKALTQELCYGTLRHLGPLRALVRPRLLRPAADPQLEALLWVAFYQLQHGNAAAHAVVSNAVDAAGLLRVTSAKGLVNAVLRDYGRLGMLLANDGALDGRQILPKEYLRDASDWHRQPEAFAPRKATPYFGYGYQFWLFPGEKRRFALLGVYGQSIFVDPELKLVMVITAAAKNASVGKESLGRERDALWRGVVGKYGSW